MSGPTHPRIVLAVICASTFTVSLAALAINIALPSLVEELGATTHDLQWIVDAYNLVFATFVLAFGSLSDRYGRKGVLLAGLAVFGAAAVGASQAATSSARGGEAARCRLLLRRAPSMAWWTAAVVPTPPATDNRGADTPVPAAGERSDAGRPCDDRQSRCHSRSEVSQQEHGRVSGAGAGLRGTRLQAGGTGECARLRSAATRPSAEPVRRTRPRWARDSAARARGA